MKEDRMLERKKGGPCSFYILRAAGICEVERSIELSCIESNSIFASPMRG